MSKQPSTFQVIHGKRKPPHWSDKLLRRIQQVACQPGQYTIVLRIPEQYEGARPQWTVSDSEKVEG